MVWHTRSSRGCAPTWYRVGRELATHRVSICAVKSLAFKGLSSITTMETEITVEKVKHVDIFKMSETEMLYKPNELYSD